jgi:N-hydroxyarylamine O-acetyltransferase
VTAAGGPAGITAVDPEAYLLRLGDRGPREPNPDTLTRLHRAHLRAVPFENLDICLGVPIRLELPALYDKIVARGRGGFCYELNGLFGWLLGTLGFRLELLSARVFDDGRPGREFDHLLLLVDLGDRWIADVGFGDSFVEPLPLDGGPVRQDGSDYRLVTEGPDRILERRRAGAGWKPQYAFTLTPRRLADFGPMCEFQQTSPESAFTGRSVCSRATAGGRITLSNGRLIVTEGERREERAVAGVEECRALLAERFGVALDPDTPLERVLSPRHDTAMKTGAAP